MKRVTILIGILCTLVLMMLCSAALADIDSGVYDNVDWNLVPHV